MGDDVFHKQVQPSSIHLWSGQEQQQIYMKFEFRSFWEAKKGVKKPQQIARHSNELIVI